MEEYEVDVGGRCGGSWGQLWQGTGITSKEWARHTVEMIQPVGSYVLAASLTGQLGGRMVAVAEMLHGDLVKTRGRDGRAAGLASGRDGKKKKERIFFDSQQHC